MDEQADPLAEAAIAELESGMLIGIGAGKTASRGLEAIAARVRNDHLDVQVIPASERAERRAAELGLQVADFSTVEGLDLLIDGADEVDRELRLLKGSRGAVTRERMLAWASERRVYLVGEHKVSPRIGTNATLAVAVMAFGLASTRAAVRETGLHGVMRRDMDGTLFVNDNGNLILDVALSPEQDLRWVASELNGIPGVVGHGLFLDEADVLLVEHDNGQIERLSRE